jgi:hypothetical protein
MEGLWLEQEASLEVLVGVHLHDMKKRLWMVHRFAVLPAPLPQRPAKTATNWLSSSPHRSLSLDALANSATSLAPQQHLLLKAADSAQRLVDTI